MAKASKTNGKNGSLGNATDKELDHEQMRIRTMGERITQRLKTIGKAKKMMVFALALEMEGMSALANKAWSRLHEMGYTPSGRPVRS